MCIRDSNPMVESVITNVALGASEDQFDRAATSNKGKVGVAFVEYSKRNGVSTRAVSYTHLRAHETVLDLVCRLLLEKKKKHHNKNHRFIYNRLTNQQISL